MPSSRSLTQPLILSGDRGPSRNVKLLLRQEGDREAFFGSGQVSGVNLFGVFGLNRLAGGLD